MGIRVRGWGLGAGGEALGVRSYGLEGRVRGVRVRD